MRERSRIQKQLLYLCVKLVAPLDQRGFQSNILELFWSINSIGVVGSLGTHSERQLKVVSKLKIDFFRFRPMMVVVESHDLLLVNFLGLQPASQVDSHITSQ